MRSGQNLSQVSVGLFLSDLDLALRLSVLTSRNITLIINSSGLENVSYPLLDGLQVLHVPIQDQPHTPLRQCFDHVAEQITQNQTRTTLVHCTAGRSRSPALIMACLKVSASVKQVIEQRPFIRPNAGFWRQLMDYERALFAALVQNLPEMHVLQLSPLWSSQTKNKLFNPKWSRK
uniref:Tyrosine-protein phosphatase domain-containing protein n=1 Tax=Echeneis naucrates TaxID=173247 RepID=A0A665UJP6_ECHNA